MFQSSTLLSPGKNVKILRTYGIPTELLKENDVISTDTTARQGVHEEITEPGVLAGLLQGDTLAQFLFIIVLDNALKNATEGHCFTVNSQIEKE